MNNLYLNFAQPNIERKPLEEMLAAEQSGAFQCNGGTSSAAEFEAKSTEAMIDRLQDLTILMRESSSKTPAAAPASAPRSVIPEKTTTKSASSTRPLTVDDEDLDIDLEIDDNIDTTVSPSQVFGYFL